MELVLGAFSGHAQLMQRADCWNALGLLCQGVLWMVPVLVLTGIESFFFIVATTELCFALVLKTVSIIQGCFHYC